MIKSIFANLISAAILTTLGLIYRAIKLNNNSDSCSYNYDAKEIHKIKKQFYICFLTAVAISAITIISTSQNTFLDVGIRVLLFWLFLFSLFAFMSAVEIIESFCKKLSDSNTKKASDNGTDKIR